MKLDTVIGLEFHVQLSTKSKMYCFCNNEAEPKNPNINICPICMGHPGTLPTVNENAIQMAIKAGLALNCKINKFTKFDRKNYFYPDLPKGYQISQFDKPIAEHGYFDINFAAPDGLAAILDDEKQMKQISITRVHVEEDSAKSTHDSNGSLIDYNRAGAPLIEIVSGADISTPQEAKTFAQELQLLIRSLKISDADMEKGHLRCDANISLKPHNANQLYPKTEIKNINSFHSLEKALEFEIKRQQSLWLENNAPQHEETRGWDDKKMVTVSQRTKEGQADYRYFPEPDIPPLTFTDEQITAIKQQIPELPQQQRQRFIDEYSFTPEQTKLLTQENSIAEYTEKVISELQEWLHSLPGKETNSWDKNKSALITLAANWIINKLLPLLKDNKSSLAELKITAENFAEFLTLIHQKKLNSNTAQKVLEKMFQNGEDPSHIIDEQNLGQVEDQEEILIIIQKIITSFPKQVQEYKNGKEPIIKFLLGQVMKESKGNANPTTAEVLLVKELKK